MGLGLTVILLCQNPGWGGRDTLILSGLVGRGCQVSGDCWPSKSTNREERKDLSSGPRLSKMDFQDLTSKLLLGLKWIQPELRHNYSLVHDGQRVSKRHSVIFL